MSQVKIFRLQTRDKIKIIISIIFIYIFLNSTVAPKLSKTTMVALIVIIHRPNMSNEELYTSRVLLTSRLRRRSELNICFNFYHSMLIDIIGERVVRNYDYNSDCNF